MGDWKDIVRTVAPAIASTFGGPLAGMGIKALSEIVLGKPDGEEEEIGAALKLATPETLQKIKAGDRDFKLQMKKLDIDLENIARADRDSARDREKEIKDTTPAALAYLLTAGFFGALFALFMLSIPTANEKIVYIMIGSLGTAWVGAMAYYHGTSRSSARKDNLISQLKK